MSEETRSDAEEVQVLREQLKSATEKLEVALREAKEANRVKVNFLSVVSHEMRTPLNPIIGYIQLLREVLDNPEYLVWVDLMYQSSRHLHKLIDDILEYSRMESMGVTLEMEALDLGHLLCDLKIIFQERAVRRNIKFIWVGEQQYNEQSQNLSCVMTDGQKLRTILLNLLSNAFKFTSDGEIRYGMVSCLKDDGHLCVRFFVQDTGIGIEGSNLKRLFQPFSQVDGSLARKYEGVGLGLAISKRLVDAMGGTLTVNSEPGRGSEFAFELILPVSQGETLDDVSVATSLSEQDVQAVMPERVLNILLVDCHTISCKMAAGICRRLGHQLVSEVDAAKGLEQIQRWPGKFDLVLLDSGLPPVDGKPVVQLIREFEGGQSGRCHKIYELSPSSAAPSRRVPFAGDYYNGHIGKPLRLKDLKEVCEWVMTGYTSAGHDVLSSSVKCKSEN